MGESSSSHHHHQTPSSRLGFRAASGEIVEVQGGHIVRSTGRKDRHSKVCTSKGPRDRRVRLAAHTAIQFYDVQDRLGYDRPSKAVDWLINKAKAAIDELDHLPPWHPTDGSEKHEIEPNLRSSDEKIRGNAILGSGDDSSFLPPSLDSDAIADTIKSFFPISAASTSSAMEFDNFPTPDLMSRNVSNSSSQDLRLSLQSLSDPILLHHHQNPNPPNQQTQVLLTAGTSLGFDGSSSGWALAEHHHPRFANWNSGGETSASGGSGYLFNPPAPQFLVQHNQFYSQRGPLQSSNTPSVRAWMDPSAIAERQHSPLVPMYHGLPNEGGCGFSGFHIPARIQGEDEEHDGYSDKPSSASSDSYH